LGFVLGGKRDNCPFLSTLKPVKLVKFYNDRLLAENIDANVLGMVRMVGFYSYI
jgi:hypothetical protein